MLSKITFRRTGIVYFLLHVESRGEKTMEVTGRLLEKRKGIMMEKEVGKVTKSNGWKR